MMYVILSVLAKPKKLVNTAMVAGFESVETGNSIVTPQSYVVKTQTICLKQYTLHSSRTHIEPNTKHITSNE